MYRKNEKIMVLEIYDGERKEGYFSSLKVIDYLNLRFVILRADSGFCYICKPLKEAGPLGEYYTIGYNNQKHYIEILMVGTTDENFKEVEDEIRTNIKKYC